MQLSIEANFEGVQKKLKELQQDVAAKALASTVNKVLAKAKTAMSREIRAEFNLTASKVGEALRVNRASFKAGLFSIQGQLYSPSKRGQSLNLINFSAKQTARSRKGGGLSVKIKRSTGTKILRGAFIGNQGRTVFSRTGEAKRVMTKGFNKGKLREPIKAKQTIAVAQMFNTRTINRKVVQFIEADLPRIFDNEVKYFTDRFNRAR